MKNNAMTDKNTVIWAVCEEMLREGTSKECKGTPCNGKPV